MQRELQTLLAVWCVWFGIGLQGMAQDAAAVGERMLAVQKGSSVESDGQEPFHLKVSFVLYDELGKLGTPGTLEVWYASPHKRSETWTLDGQPLQMSQTVTRAAYILGNLSRLFLRPVSPNLQHVEWLAPKTMQVGKTMLDCYTETGPPQDAMNFCLGKQNHELRIVTGHEMRTVYATLGHFRGFTVPVDLVEDFTVVRLLTAHLQTLEAVTMEQALAAIPPPVPVSAEARNASGTDGTGVRAGRKIGGEAPSFPEDYALRRTGGAVLVGEEINQEGTSTNVTLLAATDRQCAQSAIKAVRTWRYEPYLLNGQPVEARTVVAVTFNPSSR